MTTRRATGTTRPFRGSQTEKRRQYREVRKRVVMVVVPEQVITTPAAEELVSRLEEKHGELMFHQSGGCCDGSSPMCYPRGEVLAGDCVVLMAPLARTPFFFSKTLLASWQHTHLILVVVPYRAAMCSLH